jgi:hypothetical protein
VGTLYTVLAVSSFVGWHVLRGTQTRYQHAALYAVGLISATIAFFTFFEEMNIITSMIISYVSLIFAALYILDPSKTERYVSYLAVSIMGSYLSVFHIVEASPTFETLLIVVSLLPAIAAVAIAKLGKRAEFFPPAQLYSFASAVLAGIFVLGELIEYIDFSFVFFYVIPLAILSYVAYVHVFSHDSMSHDAKSKTLRIVLVWFALSYIGVFFTLFNSVYPAPTDTTILNLANQNVTDWTLVKGIFGTAILFVGLFISRQLQLEQAIKRPSFILVIFGFASLLLTGNYIISALMNDLGVSMAEGGPRAVATSLWWAAIAIYMLYVGIKRGQKYRSEKLLGLVLLALTVGKVILYDIATMGMQNKIIVLMLVGGAMLLFSYFVRSKDMLPAAPEGDQSE